MIIYFSVKNFRSYKDETVLNFVSSSKIKKMPDHERKFGRLSVLKNIGIFGSNAFGKSNILNALGAMVSLIITGSCHENLAFIDSIDEPTSFDIAFICDDETTYEYSFSIKKDNVLSPYTIVNEELYQLFKSGTNNLIYSKEKGLQNIDSEPLRYFTDAYKNASGQLFLSYINAPERRDANSKVSQLLKKVFTFFVSNIIVRLDDNPMLFLVNKENIEEVTEYLKKYDIGIVGVDFIDLSPNEVNTIINNPVFNLLRNDLIKKTKLNGRYFSDGKEVYSVTYRDDDYQLQKLIFRHRGIKSSFSYSYESVGTKRIFTLLALLFDKNNSNKTIAIDEIERSAFSEIASELIRDFQEEFKDTNAQLLFTSHLHSLFDTALRKDEIYFVDKGVHGESRLYPLSDFKTMTKENITKEFLDGSFGGIPKIGVKIKNGASD